MVNKYSNNQVEVPVKLIKYLLYVLELYLFTKFFTVYSNRCVQSFFNRNRPLLNFSGNDSMRR